MWLGCVLVVIVLALFLHDWRTAFISITAIPLSLIAAALVLRWRGETLNTMVLAGLVIALGEVVDDAIIDVENILRRLRQNRALAEPRPAFAVVLDASLEVRSAVVYASAIVVLVFLPVFFLDGLMGTFFRPLALSYILSILASLVVALTLTPALSLMLLRGRVAGAKTRRAAGARCSRPAIAVLLPPLLRAPWAVCGRARRGVRRDVVCVSAPRRGDAAEFQGARFSHALGRETRDLARRDDAHHHLREQGTARHSRRAQSGRAHRPHGSRRRSGRAELHRAVDFARPESRLRLDREESAGGRGRLSRPAARPAHVSARAHQGSAHRRRARASSCASSARTCPRCARRRRRSRASSRTCPA